MPVEVRLSLVFREYPMWPRLCELLEQTAGAHVLVVGDFMLDRYLYGDAERISPEAPVPVLRVVREEVALGGAGSVVADIAALGAVPHCVGLAGDDADGERLRYLLKQTNARVEGLVTEVGRRTTRKTRLVGLAQHRHRQQLIRVDDETTESPCHEASQRLLDHVRGCLARCAVVCLEDYDKGVIRADLARSIIAVASQYDVPIIVDPASIPEYSRYSGATLATPNRMESENLIGAALRTLEEVERQAPRILERCHTEYVCVTLDADGAALIGPGGRFEHVPTKKRDVYDVTGAGDEVLAALAVAKASGATWPEAVHLANVAGGLEVEKFGCVPVTRDEVLAEILMEHHKALGKVRSIDQLLPELSRRRARGEKVVFTNGCFDLIHAGHVATFAFCKEHADILVVGLNSDESVQLLRKGNDRPIVGQDDRARVLAAMADIDYIAVFNESTPASLIEAVRPDVLVKGGDWEDKTVVGREVVEANGGKVLLMPLIEGTSSTGIIERIRGTQA